MPLATEHTQWFWEHINPDLILGSTVQEVLFKGHSRYQSIELLKTGSFSRCLVLDGKIQSAETDEFVYHEALVHPPLVAHPDPQSVLIAGGGEGATLREVVKHRSVQRVVMLDIDKEVVDLCKTYLPNHHQGAFDDPRLDLHFTDARQYLAEHQDTYDAIILDLPDPVEGGPAYKLYTQRFYELVQSRLSPGGVVVVQAGSCGPTMFQEAFTAIHHTMISVFGTRLYPYRASVPSFGGLWGFIMFSPADDPSKLSVDQVDHRLHHRVSNGLTYYDGETHAGIFHLPKYLRAGLAEETRLITEENPLFVF